MFQVGDRVIERGRGGERSGVVHVLNDGSDPYMCSNELGIRFDDYFYRDDGEWHYAFLKDLHLDIAREPDWRL
jgi:hypothetical protein